MPRPPSPNVLKNDLLLLATSRRRYLSSDVESIGRKTNIDRVIFFEVYLLDEVFFPSSVVLLILLCFVNCERSENSA